MKKFLKVLLVLFVMLILLLAGVSVAFKIMFSNGKLKAMAQDYVKTNFNREVSFNSVSLNLLGVTITDFALSESSTFAEGTFVSAQKLVVKIDFRELLSKKIKIYTLGLENLNVNIIKNKDGSFNFDDLLALASKESAPAEQKQEEAPSAPVDLKAEAIYLNNAAITFTDKQNNMSFGVRRVNIKVDNFDFENNFNYDLSLITDVNMPAIKLTPVNIAASGNANLANMKLADGVFNVNSLNISYKTAKISLSGSISDFENPSVLLKGSLTGINDNLVSEFVSDPLPSFILPEVKLSVNAASNIQKNSTKVNNIKASIGNSHITLVGNADYSKPDLVFDFKTDIAVSLTEIAQIAKDTDVFKLKGSVNGALTGKNGPKMPLVNGSINLKGVGASYEGKSLSDITGVITIKSLEDISTNIITGKLMGSAFKTSLGYKQLGKVMDIALFFHMDKFTLDDINFDGLFKTDNALPVKEEQKASAVSEAPRSVPMNIRLDVSIDKIENNIFTTNDFILKTNITNFDNKMDRADGVISFSTAKGEIRDLNKLMESFVIFRVVFSSVRILQSAFNVLKLDGTLGTDKITYSLIDTNFTMDKGVVNIDKMELYSDLTTAKAHGTINLVNESLKMKLEAHLGKLTSASGFKPVIIAVGGTMTKPTYKLDVISSVTSILNVPGTVAKNTAGGAAGIVRDVSKGTANTVKDVIGGVSGLFKKKK